MPNRRRFFATIFDFANFFMFQYVLEANCMLIFSLSFQTIIDPNKNEKVSTMR